MKVMVVGGGGREHAIIKSLRKSKEVSEIYCLPGNGGIAADAVCVPEIGTKNISAIVDFAKKMNIDYAVVSQDDPLALGAVDELNAIGVPCFGPDKKAAEIESSKVFSKNLMKKYGIPTAAYEVFDDPEQALSYVRACKIPVVIKVDGLALGKGVIIAQTHEEAAEAVHTIMLDKAFGNSGNQIVVEEYLTGPEVSLLSFTDGETIIPMVSSMDHKRVGEGDTGPNTGGMGTIAPNPCYTEAIAHECMDKIFLPTIHAMQTEGRPFKGCLYFGLMLTPDGPKVIEYNCRFGDPEAQVVLPLLKSDLLTIMRATTNGTLAETRAEFSNEAACCVIMASKGYPEKYDKGAEIFMTKEAAAHAYAAGVKKDGDKLITAGGRVLGVTATATTLAEAIRAAYHLTEGVSFATKYMRTDIGASALKATEE